MRTAKMGLISGSTASDETGTTMIKKLHCFLEKPFDTLSNLSALLRPVSFIPPRSGAA